MAQSTAEGGASVSRWWGPAAIAVFLIGWELVARYIVTSRLALVPPSDVATLWFEMAMSGELWIHLRVSFYEYFAGMSIALSFGLALGVAMGRIDWLRAAFDPLLSGLYSTPAVALAPLFIIWFGIDAFSKIALIAFIAFSPTAIATSTGLASVDPGLVEVGTVFRASRWRMAWSVLIPAAMPTIISGIRLSAGRGLIGVIIGEFFGSRAGLGYLILIASQMFDMTLLFVGVVTLAFAGIAITVLLVRLERHFSGHDATGHRRLTSPAYAALRERWEKSRALLRVESSASDDGPVPQTAETGVTEAQGHTSMEETQKKRRSAL